MEVDEEEVLNDLAASEEDTQNLLIKKVSYLVKISLLFDMVETSVLFCEILCIYLLLHSFFKTRK